MFDGLVERYDLLNDVLSLGMDRWWRRSAAAALDADPGSRILDLGCGTGRLGELLASGHPVTGVDVSSGMLSKARRRAAGRLSLVQGSAFRLPFREGSFGGAVSAFVLRNLDDLTTAFAELARVVAPGGRVVLLDITEPSRQSVRRAFDAYFHTVAPAVGALAGKREEYRYLANSLSYLPSPKEMCQILTGAGFVGCSARRLTGGLVTLWSAGRGPRIGLSG
jgi:demethylmenaquinone methyltransferase / 2-methoxy-6-polyprenyl-1,4-benzoquinol methylase